MATIRPTTVTFSFIIRHLEEQELNELMCLLDGYCEEDDIDNYILARDKAQDIDELDIIIRGTPELREWTTLLRKFLGVRVVRNDSISPKDSFRRLAGGKADKEVGDKIGEALDGFDRRDEEGIGDL